MRESLCLICGALLCMMVSCVDKDVDGAANPVLPPLSEVSDFSTEKDVELNIDYGYVGYSPIFNIYIENPYNEDGSKKDLKPYFSAFTDENSRFSSTITIPAYVEKVYLCSSYVGVPRCLSLDVENSAITYKYEMPELPGNIVTRADVSSDCYVVKNPKRISKDLYALYTDIQKGSTYSVTYWAYNKNVDGLYVVEDTPETSNLLRRVQDALTDKRGNKKDNSQYTSDSEHTNISIPTSYNGKEVKDCHLDLVFLSATGDYENAMGYYYYKTGTTPNISELPKFLVFPLTTDGNPNHPVRARLQFYGENYESEGTDDFPSGYTIGWVLFPNIDRTVGGFWFQGYDSWNINDINAGIAEIYNSNMAIYSNSEYNYRDKKGCITLNDTQSGKVIIGFEDQTNNPSGSDNSFDDILFYVESNPDVIYDDDRPNIPEKPEDDPIEESYIQTATIAFEDVWPVGGDYDLNDVIVEHTRTVTHNNNGWITKIEDAFKVVNLKGSADYNDAFGFTVASNAVGSVTGAYQIEESNQFIMFADAQACIGETYTLTRSFKEGELSTRNFDDEFDPFIVINYVAGEKNRSEVHLPKMSPTSWADLTQRGAADDAYYVNKNGKYPFAISLAGVTNWVPVTETVAIGSEGEYPEYNQWVEAGMGDQHANWYLHKN